MKEDSLGDRMKGYENTFRYLLPRRTNIMLRIDGKAFHTYTKNCKRPFDDDLMDDMNQTAIKLCEEIQGAKLAYVQSDEISILVTDYDDINTMSWFGNNLQKMVSVSASIATSEFNKLRLHRETKKYPLQNDSNYIETKYSVDPGIYDAIKDCNSANFDSRAFIIPELAEVANYFLWRSQDCSRNSIQMVARSLYSHAECEDKNCSQLQDMMVSKGLNWNDLAPKYKRGRIIIKDFLKPISDKNNNIFYSTDKANWRVADLEDFNFEYWFDTINKQVEKDTIK